LLTTWAIITTYVVTTCAITVIITVVVTTQVITIYYDKMLIINTCYDNNNYDLIMMICNGIQRYYV